MTKTPTPASHAVNTAPISADLRGIEQPDDLHAAILKLRAWPSDATMRQFDNAAVAYKLGHRDARHAAAELVARAAPASPAQQDVHPAQKHGQPAGIPSREEIASLRVRYGITSSGRGIKELEQVVSFVQAALARWGTAPAQAQQDAPAAQPWLSRGQVRNGIRYMTELGGDALFCAAPAAQPARECLQQSAELPDCRGRVMVDEDGECDISWRGGMPPANGTYIYTEQQVRALQAAPPAPARQGLTTQQVEDLLLDAGLPQDMREAIIFDLVDAEAAGDQAPPAPAGRGSAGPRVGREAARAPAMCVECSAAGMLASNRRGRGA